MKITTRHCDNCGHTPAFEFRYGWEQDVYDPSLSADTADLCPECMVLALESFTHGKKSSEPLSKWVLDHRKFLLSEGKQRG